MFTTRLLRKSLVRVTLLFLLLLNAFALSVRAGFLYVLNDDTATAVYGYSVNETTGALTPVPGSPFAAGAGSGNTVSERLTIDRANGRLYVINDSSNSDTVRAYSINQATGALAPLPFSPITLPSGNWFTIAVHPSGSPLLVSNSISLTVNSYNITPTTAVAATGSPFSIGASAFSSVFSRSGNYFYAGGNTDSTFAGFSVNQTTGVLTALAGSPFNSGAGNPLAYATDAQGRLFMANFSTAALRAFTTTNGVPSAVTGNPFASGLTSPIDGVLSPSGNFYYVADRDGNRVGAYQVAGSGAATTLAAVAGSPSASGGLFTDALAFNAVGTVLFAANGSSRNLTTYNVNQTTGALTLNNVQAANALGTTGLLTGLDYISFNSTAAGITISGRVELPADRLGPQRVPVTLTDSQGNARTILAGKNGVFRFEEAVPGATYIITVNVRGVAYAPQVVVASANVTDLYFAPQSGI